VSGFFKVVKRELERMVKEPICWFCLVIAPIFCFYFFTSFMGSGLPTDMPIGLVDEDNTSTTRSLVRNLNSFQQTEIVDQYPNVSEARKAVQRGEIYGFYYIPKGTTTAATAFKVPTVSFYTNFSYLVAGSLLSRDMRTMSELASAAAMRKILWAKGASDEMIMPFVQPIVVQTHTINNPWLNYNVYLSNTLIPGIYGIFVLMLTCFVIGIEIKDGTASQWLATCQGNMLRALTAKLLPYTLVFILVGGLLDIYLYGYLAFPCHCSVWTMFLVMVLYVLALQGLAVFFITLIPTIRLSLSACSLWGVVSFSICGMSFPTMAMHPVIQGAALLFPLRHYYLLYVNCALDGFSIWNAGIYVAWLLAFVFVGVAATPWLKKQLLSVKYIP